MGEEMKICMKHKITPNCEENNILLQLGFFATKLYNTDNYIRREAWQKTGKIPNWYEQKKLLKDNHWFKLLPSQTAQQVCKTLQDNYVSWYKTRKNNLKSNPPLFRKKEKISSLSFYKFKIENDVIRFPLSKKFKEEVGFGYLFFKLNSWKQIDGIPKMATILYKNNKWMVNIIYEITEPKKRKFYNIMAIDLGIINLATTVDLKGNSTIYKGSQALAIQYYFNKEIAKNKSKTKIQHGKKWSNAISRMNNKMTRQTNQIIHTVSKSIVDEAKRNKVGTIIVGDIKNIRKGKKWNKKSSQKLHSWAFSKLTSQIEYKAKLSGIQFKQVSESYTSQTCSNCEIIKKSNRKYRGLYICKECGLDINADVNGSINILKKYLQENNISRSIGSMAEPLIWRCKNVIPS